jgi:HEAT repeat protein
MMGMFAHLLGKSDIKRSKGKHIIQRLLRALAHRDDYVRLSAVRALDALGDSRAVEPLATALGDPAISVRLTAVRALDALGDPRAVEPLCAVLKDKHLSARMAAVRALGALGDPRAVEPLCAALDDPAYTVRMAAVRALGALGDPRAVEPLATALKDHDPKTREASVQALSALDDPRAVMPLCGALKDESRAVREAATSALRKLHDPRAVVPLCGALADADPELRRAAAVALGELGDRLAVLPLCAALDDASIDVRSAAAAALGQIKDPRALKPLIAAISRHRFHTDILVWALQRRHRALRRVAAEALGNAQLAAPEITALNDAQSDSDPDVRRAAAMALDKIAARVGRLRTDRAEQQRLMDCLAQLPIVDVAHWLLLHSARFGPMTPGDDTMMEQTFKSPDQLIQFLVGEKSMLRMSWSASGEAVVIEYFYQSTGRLNERFVILRHGKPAEFLCYLAWLMVHHGSYETVQLEVSA